MAVEPWLSCCRRVHHHQCHVAGGGRCVSPTAWPQRMARLQSFISELLDPRPIWSIHWVWVYHGVVSRRDQDYDQPTNRCACEAPCAQEHHSSGAMCPKTEMRRAASISPSGVRSVRACMSTLLTKSDQRIPSIWRWHFMWKASNAFMSVAGGLELGNR